MEIKVYEYDQRPHFGDYATITHDGKFQLVVGGRVVTGFQLPGNVSVGDTIEWRPTEGGRFANATVCLETAGQCTQMTVCYPVKQCQHEPDEFDGPGCKADSHSGPVTVSGRTLRCSGCGYLWEIAHEGPGPR